MAFSCQTINQTKLYLVPMSGTKTVTILVLAPVGSRYETKATSGLSHFIEHLMFKGTKRRPTTLVLTREIDRLGAEYNIILRAQAINSRQQKWNGRRQ